MNNSTRCNHCANMNMQAYSAYALDVFFLHETSQCQTTARLRHQYKLSCQAKWSTQLVLEITYTQCKPKKTQFFFIFLTLVSSTARVFFYFQRDSETVCNKVLNLSINCRDFPFRSKKPQNHRTYNVMAKRVKRTKRFVHEHFCRDNTR